MKTSDQVYCSLVKNKTDIEDSCVSYLVLKDRSIVYGNPLKFEGFELTDNTLHQFSKHLIKRIEDKLKKCGRYVNVKINIYKNMPQFTYAFEIYTIQDYVACKTPPNELLMPACISRFERSFYNLESIVEKKRELLVKN